MQLLFVVFLFALYVSVSSVAVPPSPAGGEYLRIYAPGDYAFAPDHDDFDIASKEGYTIEMWFYVKRPLQRFDLKAVQPYERWSMIYKAGSYEVVIAQSGTPNFRSETKGTGLRETGAPPLNQWHYCVITISGGSLQRGVNREMWGKRLNNGFLNLNLADTDSPFFIGGGNTSAIRGIKGEAPDPWVGKPVWIPYTDGFIDEVRISNIVRYPRGALNAWREARVIEVPKGRFEPDEHTLALWHFDFAGYVGSKWRDASGNGHHLTYKGTYQDVSLGGKLPLKWAELKRR